MKLENSWTLRGVPIAGAAGYHRDDWESIGIRIRPDGSIDQRASSHNGYNHTRGVANWGSDAGIGPLKAAAEALDARARNGWGPETRILLVSGGSHAGNAKGIPDFERLTFGRDIHLVPLEPIAQAAMNSGAVAPLTQHGPAGNEPGFAVTPPWHKHVWRDPEAGDTN